MARQDTYPRATPFRSSEVNGQMLSATLANPPRRYWLLAGICSLCLVIGLGVGLFVLKNQSAAAEKGKDTPTKKTEDNADPKDKLPEVPPVGFLSKDPTLASPALPLKEVPPADEKETPGLPGLKGKGGLLTSQPGKPTSIPDTVSEALGELTASHLYQTYLNIGLLADSVEGEVYEKDEAKKVLDTVAGLMTSVDKQIDRVARQVLSAEERKAAEQAQQIMNSLRTQARELQSYWENGQKDHVTRFHQARKDSWDGIKTLLNITE